MDMSEVGIVASLEEAIRLALKTHIDLMIDYCLKKRPRARPSTNERPWRGGKNDEAHPHPGSAGSPPAAGKDLAPGREPQDPSPPLAVLPGATVDGFTHPGSPRTRWKVREIVIQQYQAPGSRRRTSPLKGEGLIVTGPSQEGWNASETENEGAWE